MSLGKNIDDIQFDFVKSSQRIRKLRESSKETHTALGRAIGVSEQTLKNYEQAAIHGGQTTGQDRVTKIAGMSINTLCLLADHYGVTTDYLLGRSDVRSPDTNLQAVCDFTGLSEKSVNRITQAYRWVELLYSREDYQSADGIGDIKNALDYLLSSDSFFELLNQICLVNKATEYAKSELKLYYSGAMSDDEQYDCLTSANKELKFSLYELSNYSRGLANDLGAQKTTEELRKEISKIVVGWGEKYQKESRGADNDV